MYDLEAYNSWIASIGRTINGLKSLSDQFDLPELQKFKIYYQKSLYITLVCHDLMMNIKHFDIAETDKKYFEANYFGRTLALQASEIFGYVSNFTGGEVLQSMEAGGYDEHLVELKKIGKEIGQLNKADGDYVREIRNKASAHKDPDVVMQIAIMSGVDNPRIAHLGFKLFEHIKSLAEVYQRLMNDMVGLKG